MHDVPRTSSAQPAFSLLRLSVPQRLLGVAALLALMWAAIVWALA